MFSNLTKNQLELIELSNKIEKNLKYSKLKYIKVYDGYFIIYYKNQMIAIDIDNNTGFIFYACKNTTSNLFNPKEMLNFFNSFYQYLNTLI